MLKIVVAACCVASIIAWPEATQDKPLLEDFQDFVNEVEWDRVLALVNLYYSKDSDFKTALAYLQGNEFKIVWSGFFDLAVVKELGDYLVGQGVPFYDTVAVVADFLGQSNHRARTGRPSSVAIRPGLKGFVEELFALLPIEKLNQLYQEKMSHSSPFQAFMTKLRNANYNQFRDFYLDVPEFRSFIQVVRRHGIDVDSWEQSIRQFLGW